jgi:alpha-tubulin suppressor-like RCC1 family protein
VHVLVRDLAGNSNLVLGADRKLYLLGNDGSASQNRSLVDLFDGGEWQSIAFAGSVSCGIKTDGTMWSWGTQGNVQGALFGDLSEFGTQRTTPVQVASEAEWVRVRHFWDPLENGAMMLAIRKDAICRAIDQPFELWPNWAYGGTT